MSFLKIKKAEAHSLYRCMAATKVGVDSRIIFFHVTREHCAFSFSSVLFVILSVFILFSFLIVHLHQVACRSVFHHPMNP